MTTFTLPWPPTANNSKLPVTIHSKKTGKKVHRQVPTKALKDYQKTVLSYVLMTRAYRIPGYVRVQIDVHEPDRRRRDIANLEKAPIDALVAAGVIEDDSLIDDLRIVRHRDQLIPGGLIKVSITPLNEGADA